MWPKWLLTTRNFGSNCGIEVLNHHSEVKAYVDIKIEVKSMCGSLSKMEVKSGF